MLLNKENNNIGLLEWESAMTTKTKWKSQKIAANICGRSNQNQTNDEDASQSLENNNSKINFKACISVFLKMLFVPAINFAHEKCRMHPGYDEIITLVFMQRTCENNLKYKGEKKPPSRSSYFVFSD